MAETIRSQGAISKSRLSSSGGGVRRRRPTFQLHQYGSEVRYVRPVGPTALATESELSGFNRDVVAFLVSETRKRINFSDCDLSGLECISSHTKNSAASAWSKVPACLSGKQPIRIIMNSSSKSTASKNIIARLGLCLALALLPLLTTGCVIVAAGAVGAGAVVYVRGELESIVDAPYAKLVDATRSALKDLEYVKISEKKDALEAEFIYRTALDKKVTLRLNKMENDLSRLRIRIDVIGDEALSKTILEKIKANL
jgi:Protein of unknown function (DUF3568)